MMRWIKMLAAVLLVSLLAACGGGGGNAGTTSGSNGGSNGGSNTATGTPTFTVSVVDASGQAVTAIRLTGQYFARAQLKDATGAPVASRLVSFSISGASIAALTPETALTDSNGVAQTSIAPTSAAAAGATTLVATTTSGTTALTAQTDFAVSPTGSNQTSGNPTVVVTVVDSAGQAVSSISSTSTYSAKAVVRDASGAAVSNKLVTFSIVGPTIATVNPATALTDSNGTAQTTLVASSASAAGATTLQATATVGTTAVNGQRDFAVSSTGVIVTTGTPSLSVNLFNAAGLGVSSISTSETFTAKAVVKDSFGVAVANKLVTFSITGPSIATVSPATALTDATGTAQTTVVASSASAAGATTLAAAATVGTTAVTAQRDFAVTNSGTGAGAPTLSLSIVNASGQPVNNISVASSFTARAVLKDSFGTAVPNKVVTFSLGSSGIAALTPSTALTDASGVASVSLAPTSVTGVGASTLSASATVGTATVNNQLDFGVTPTNISLASLQVGTTTLGSGGNTPVSVQVLVGGQVPTSGTPVNVTFSASCGRINGGTSSFGATTNGSGLASATYTAVSSTGELCSGPVTITAASSGAASLSTTINVATPVANAITFVSATPSQIFVAGSGAVEQSVVKFKVLSGSTPLANTQVKFSIAVNPGGVGLGATGSTADVTATTDAAGEASVPVFSGTIPGPVKVRAALVGNESVFAETQNLTVASGPPSQRFMSLSVSTYNIEGWAWDGAPTTLTVRVADRQGNPVADGTVINFTAEGGQVAPSCATSKTNGISSCSVDFISQNPRPAGGRVSVLAFTNGTKDYVDVNGNNRYDAGVDTLVNIGDAYRDDNENATFDAGEFVVPRGGTSTCAASGWPFPSRANTCDSNLSTTVRQQAVILFSSTTPKLLNITKSNTLISFNLASNDNQLLPMPAGTRISVQTSSPSASGCSAPTISPATVPNVGPSTDTTVSLATFHTINFQSCFAGDAAVITITTPTSGTVFAFPFTF